jgi:antirestriction protein ArdC
MAKKRRTRKSRGPARDHYQEITDRMVKALEEAAESDDPLAPWQKPWKVTPYGSAPHNPASGTVYRGINTWITLMVMWERGYDIPMFLTFKQANEVAAKALRAKGIKVYLRTVKTRRGKERKFWAYVEGENKDKSVGGIRAGQNKENGTGGTTVVFWKRGSTVEEDEDGNERYRSWGMLRTFTVFNVEQCDDHVREYLCPPVEESEFTPLEQCERICEGYEIETRHGGDRAYYHPGEDRIQLPKRETFATPEGYYTTRFHEMGHSTGHVSRLGRDSMKPGKHRDVHTYAEGWHRPHRGGQLSRLPAPLGQQAERGQATGGLRRTARPESGRSGVGPRVRPDRRRRTGSRTGAPGTGSGLVPNRPRKARREISGFFRWGGNGIGVILVDPHEHERQSPNHRTPHRM